MRASSAGRTWLGVSLYASGVAGLLLARPSCAFRADGGLTDFGCGDGRTVASFGAACCAMAVAAGFAASLWDAGLLAPA